jgi:predicted amidohydrolase
MTEPLQALAVEQQIYIGANLFEVDPRWPGRYFNSCFLISPQGEILLRFRRVNTATFPSPHDFMESYVGEYGMDGTFPVVETELGRIGMIACGEIAVPEVTRALMMHGAEIILHPTNENHTAAQEAAKVARAAENMVYVVSANVAGAIGFSPDGSEVGGRSRILDFRGNTLSYDESPEETVAVSALIDVSALRAARRDPSMSNTLLRTRWDMYRSFYQSIEIYPANQFLQTPMANTNELKPVLETALGNLEKAGILFPA